VLGEAGNSDSIGNLTFSRVDQVNIGDREELESLIRSAERTVAGVRLTNVGVGSSGRDIYVRVLPIPEEAVGRDRHPISLWCDGRAFEPDARPAVKKRAADGIISLFSSIIAALSPSYGAILVEWPLPCPYEILSRPDGFEFSDAYLGTNYVGESRIKSIAARFGGRKIQFENGMLFLSSGLFGEVGKSAEDLGKQVASAIIEADQVRRSRID